MSVIKVSVTDQALKIVSAPLIASGGVNETTIDFSFCNKWDGFTKTAVFYRDVENPYYVLLDENDACVLPGEVYAEYGTFYFSVFGNKDGVRRTSTIVKYKASKGLPGTPSDPTLEVYEQIMAAVGKNNEATENFIAHGEEIVREAESATSDAISATERANTIANDLETKRDNGYFKGEKGEKGDPGDKDAVLYTEQTLTPEQQAQARENIGAASAEAEATVKMIAEGFEFPVVSANKFDNVYDEDGGFVLGTGEEQKNSYRVRTSQYYPIEAGNYLYLAKSGSVGGDTVIVAFYDENKEFVSYALLGESYTWSGTSKPTARYFRVSARKDRGDDLRIYISRTKISSADTADYTYKKAIARNSVLYTEQELTQSQQEQVRENIRAAGKDDASLVFEWNEVADYEEEVGTVKDYYGQYQLDSSLNWWRTRLVAVKDGYKYRVTACVGLSSVFALAFFYDADKKMIGKYKPGSNDSRTYYMDEPIKIPEGAVFFSVSTDPATGFPFYIKEGKLEPVINLSEPFEQLKNRSTLAGKTIVNFGDSIFGNKRPPYDISTELAKRTNATVHNCGFGGTQASVHWSADYAPFSMHELANAIVSGDWTAQDAVIATDPLPVPDYFPESLALLKGLDFSNVDIITIAYGANDFTSGDALDSEENPKDITTFAGALRYSIETLLTAYPNLRIFVCSHLYRFWMDDNYVFIEDSDTRIRNGIKVTDFVEKAREVAKEYKLPFIDNYYELGFNKFNRSVYFPATDGAHPNETGNHLIAAHMARELF